MMGSMAEHLGMQSVFITAASLQIFVPVCGFGQIKKRYSCKFNREQANCSLDQLNCPIHAVPLYRKEEGRAVKKTLTQWDITPFVSISIEHFHSLKVNSRVLFRAAGS